jgi:creatinine amidohydrolase
MRWDELNWPRHEELAARGVVALLPLGAVEAHGPHLPVGTDAWISEAAAREAARRLEQDGRPALVLPTLAYAPAPFADGFAGTLSIRPATLVALIVDLSEALARRGVAALALVNSHFDPAQVGALREAARTIGECGRLRVAFPDLTRRELAARLSEEFRSGACHAGRVESSIVLAERPELVDDARRRELEALPVSLSAAIRAGRDSFESAGLADAYCGDPAAASAEEGRALVALLGEIVAEAVAAALDSSPGAVE